MEKIKDKNSHWTASIMITDTAENPRQRRIKVKISIMSNMVNWSGMMFTDAKIH